MKKRRLVYRSEGMDGVAIICDTVEQAINLFRADAETILQDGQSFDDSDSIDLWAEELTDEEVAERNQA